MRTLVAAILMLILLVFAIVAGLLYNLMLDIAIMFFYLILWIQGDI